MNNRRMNSGRRGRSALPTTKPSQRHAPALSPEQQVIVDLEKELVPRLVAPTYDEICDCLINDDHAVGEV